MSGAHEGRIAFTSLGSSLNNRHSGKETLLDINGGILWNYRHPYVFLDGVSSGLGIGDAVLRDGTVGMFPAHRQSAGGGVVYTHVPRTTAGH